jgi:hypothetical protein
MTLQDQPVWERLPGEASKAFHGFAHYRDAGPGRSVDKGWRQHQVDCLGKPQPPHGKRADKGWTDWSRRWGWVERAAAWDHEADRQVRAKLLHAQAAAKERHQRLAAGALTALSAPVRAILEALQDPAVLQRMVERARTTPEGFEAMLALIVRIAGVVPALVTVERLALGLSTSADTVDIRELATPDPVAFQITTDPTATDLAIALLDRIATGSRAETIQ